MDCPTLTWTLCEVVEAAVLGLDAVLVAVACPVHSVHPPVCGETVQVSALTAFPWTTSRHQKVLGQRGDSQQNAGKLHRGSHPQGASHWNRWLKFLILKDFSWSPSRPYFSWPETVGIPVQPESAKTTLCHGGTCDLKFLCLSPVSGPLLSSPSETGLQGDLKNRTLHSCSDQTNMTTTLCPLLLFLSLCMCVFTSEHLPPVLCAREETGAKGGESLHCFACYVLPLSCLSHLCSSCLPLPSLLPSPWRISPALPASPGRPLPPHSLKWKRGMRPLGRPPSDCARGAPLSSPLSVLRVVFVLVFSLSAPINISSDSHHNQPRECSPRYGNKSPVVRPLVWTLLPLLPCETGPESRQGSGEVPWIVLTVQQVKQQ